MEDKIISIPIKKYSIIQNSDEFLYVRLQIIKEGLNLNGSDFLLTGMESSKDTFKQKPLLCAFPKDWKSGKYKMGDGHSSNIAYDEDEDELYYSYLDDGMEKCIGFVPNETDIRIENIDGANWIILDSIIWKEYNHELVKELLKKRNKGLTNRISVEITVVDSYEDNGVEYIQSFIGNGITLLALDDSVKEGIPGANLKVYAQSEKFEKFKRAMSFAYSGEKGGKGLVFEKLSMNELCNEIRVVLSKYNIEEDGWERYRYWLIDLTDDKIIVEDYEDSKYYQIPYTVDNENNVLLEMENMEEVVLEYVPKNNFSANQKSLFISKDKLGTKKALKIDKSKESMSESAWGDVDKSSLKKECFMASNWKTACKAAFAQLLEGWDDGKEGSLKYPVMQNSDGTLVYNRYGLASALAYAQKNNETEVVSKIKSIYKKLGLDKEKEETMEKFIKIAEKNGYSYLGIRDKNLIFSKIAVFEEDDKKEMEDVKVYGIPCDKLECEDEADFDEEKFEEKILKMDDEDDDDEEGKREFEDEKKKLEEDKAAFEEEKGKFEEEKKAYDDARKMEEDEKVKLEAEKIMEDEDTGLDEKDTEELKTMLEEKKFETIDSFIKEIGFRKEMKRLNSKKGSLSFNLNVPNKETKPDESAIDKLINTLK